MATDTRWLKPWLGVVVLIALVGALAGSAMMGNGMMGPGMMWGYSGSGAVGGWGMGLGMLAMLAFWIALIVGVVLLVRWATGQAAVPIASTGTDDPTAILKRRYAAGEIDQATYERMKQELAA
jgi:putative membrane protein